MGLFSFTQEIAMDLGTANTIIITNGKIVVDEPSVVALDRRTEKMIAVGEKAKLMHEKTHENIRTIRPLRDGVIADFYACEQMMRGLIKQVNTRNHLFSPSLRMVIGVPSGSTEVELRAVRDSAEHAGGRDVYLIFEPMAAAIGIGIDVEAPEGNMIVDKGGGQILVCVAGRGYYQEEGKEAVEMKPGDCINIPAGVKHWHGAAPDSWFSHLAIEVPGEKTSSEWCEIVTDEIYGKLK